ncbi:MAG: DUF1778 domain-containing protein [Erysipelotrichaceae bacterium]|nr:DUF1778 domain-containing protein [Erysipelotrichaceae bacterium]
MSHKVYDGHVRWRNKHVTFHMSEEEAEELNRAVAVSGLTKQDYLISRVLGRDITVIPNSRVYKLLLEQMQSVVSELKDAIENNKDIDPYLKETAYLMVDTLNQMKGISKNE